MRHPQGGIIIKLMNESFPKLLHQHINTHRNTYNDETCDRDSTVTERVAYRKIVTRIKL